jgi:hypothetical protein
VTLALETAQDTKHLYLLSFFGPFADTVSLPQSLLFLAKMGKCSRGAK